MCRSAVDICLAYIRCWGHPNTEKKIKKMNYDLPNGYKKGFFTPTGEEGNEDLKDSFSRNIVKFIKLTFTMALIWDMRFRIC